MASDDRIPLAMPAQPVPGGYGAAPYGYIVQQGGAPPVLPPPYAQPVYTQAAASPYQSPPSLAVQRFSRSPATGLCPHCGAFVTTGTAVEPGLFTWIAAAGCCLTGLVLCFWMPFCVDSCQDVVHFCPSCGQKVGEAKVV